MKTLSLVAAALALSLLAPRASCAAEDGELWEVTSQMDMSGMKGMHGRDLPPSVAARMGGRTQQICRGSDPKEAVTKSKDMKECEVKDFKQSGTTVKMSVVCKEGRTATMEHVYNKARTEYTGTIHVNDPKRGEMTMNTTGKKIGACDATKAREERQARVDRIKAQAEESQVQAKHYNDLAESQQLDNCSKAVEKMDADGLGIWGACHSKKDANCKQMRESMGQMNPKVAKTCSAKADEYCERFNTPEGFMLLKQHGRLDAAENICGMKAEDLRPKLCRSAVKDEAWEFVGAACPAEAKPLAKEHCAGRSYTVADSDKRSPGKKWRKFCAAVAGTYLEGSSDEQQAESAPSKTEKSGGDEDADAKSVGKKAAKKAAINALKGLFGH